MIGEIEIIIHTADSVVILEDEKMEAIVKGLRLLLLVGNEDECLAATRLLDLILA